MRTLDLAIISESNVFRQRAQLVGSLFTFECITFPSDEAFFMESNLFKNVSCILFDFCKPHDIKDITGTLHVARQVSPSSYILVVCNKMSTEEMDMAISAGASRIITQQEYYDSSKPEFVLSQVIKSVFVPVKTMDLVEGTALTFPLYHFMPLNRRFLKVFNTNSTLTKDFLTKFSNAGDLYVQRESLDLWQEYTSGYVAKDSAEALQKSRQKFRQLNESFLSLALLVSDRSTPATFAKGKELYSHCEKFSADLLSSLLDLEDPWYIISSSAVGDYGSIERAPAVAAYAGFMSATLKVGNPTEVMIGALLADIGYLELSPSVAAKLRTNRTHEMNAEERMEYHKHPIFSLNQCLARRLPLSNNIKEIILQSHERVDQKGFPRRPKADKLLEEAMLVRLCWELDQQCQGRMGEKKPDIREIRRQFSRAAMNEVGNYNPRLIVKANSVLLPAVF
ncbi:HD-GYP domain-containing protein [Bdellovibrio bacteriovorus]